MRIGFRVLGVFGCPPCGIFLLKYRVANGRPTSIYLLEMRMQAAVYIRAPQHHERIATNPVHLLNPPPPLF